MANDDMIDKTDCHGMKKERRLQKKGIDGKGVC